MKTALLNPDYNFKYFLQLMQSVLNGVPATVYEEAVDWQVIYDIAADHSLAGMLYFALQTLPKEHYPQGEFMPYLKQMYQEQLVADLNKSFETDRIVSLLKSKGISCAPFKGIVTKRDYPQPHLRSMTDIDILCREESRQLAEKVFFDEGYERVSVGIKDSAFKKDEILYFELHSNLLDERSPAFEYFSSIWDRVSVNKETGNFEMTPEDTYIYMLEHLASHIEHGGAGVRLYMDVYVFLKANGNNLNRAYTDKILNEINLSQFEKVTLSICKNWFSGDEEIDVCNQNAAFILKSCTFGRTKVTFLSDNIRNYKGNSTAKNGISRIAGKVFPTVKWMRLKYFAVDKLPLLYPLFLPVFWVERLFIKKDVNTSNIKKYFTSDDSEAAKRIRQQFISLGLGERI